VEKMPAGRKGKVKQGSEATKIPSRLLKRGRKQTLRHAQPKWSLLLRQSALCVQNILKKPPTSVKDRTPYSVREPVSTGFL